MLRIRISEIDRAQDLLGAGGTTLDDINGDKAKEAQRIGSDHC
jgi:hypothetical protein